MAAPMASRFAVLSISDDDDSEDESTKKQQNKDGGSAKSKSTSSKKKNKKKKAEQAEKAELRDLAFGGPGPTKAKSQKHQPPSSTTSASTVKKTASDDQWKEWKKADEEFVNEQYETDLQEVLLLSKVEFERQQSQKLTMDAAGDGANVPGDGGKKKKKKKAMTLDEFQELGSEKSVPEEQISPDPTKITAPADTEFFKRINTDASKAIRKEKIQEEYKKEYQIQATLRGQHEKELNKRDKEIVMLRATVEKLKQEAKDAKQKNDDLNRIITQSQTKDKVSLLQLVEELTQTKIELMEEIANLTTELEKEKSKSHALKTEVDKFKAKSDSKHK